MDHFPNDASAGLVIELAKALMSELQERIPGWQRAYIRFEASENHHGAKGSYVTDSGVYLFDVFEFKSLFTKIKLLGVQLREALDNNGKRFCVLLLTVDSTFEYNIDFEWHDPARWQISKLGGASGIPTGLVGA